MKMCIARLQKKRCTFAKCWRFADFGPVVPGMAGICRVLDRKHSAKATIPVV
jgi:hypothetical protein